jgi:hypothetical protein
MKMKRWTALAAIGGMALAATDAAALTWNFNVLVTGDMPVGSNWATLTMDDTGPGEVSFTLFHNATSAAPQFLTRLYLNLDPIPGDLSANFGAPIVGISWAEDGFGNAARFFDVEVLLETAQEGRLDPGESVSWTMSGTGLSVSAFDKFSAVEGENAPLLALLHIQGINGEGSGKLTVVPEPATLGVLGIGALALLRRRKKA